MTTSLEWVAIALWSAVGVALLAMLVFVVVVSIHDGIVSRRERRSVR